MSRPEKIDCSTNGEVIFLMKDTCTPQTCKNVAVQRQDNAYTWKRKRALNDSTVTHRDQRYDKEDTKGLQVDVISSRCLMRNFYQNQSLELARSPPGL